MKKATSKTRSNSQRKYSTSNKVKDKKRKSHSQKKYEQIEDRILEIDLKRPKRAFNYFISEMMKIEGGKLNLVETIKKYNDTFKTLSKKEKDKYYDMSLRDQERYEENLKFVEENLLKKPENETFTGYKFYLDEFKKNQDTNKSITDIRREARDAWNSMDDNKKKVYEEKSLKNKELFEKFREYRSSKFSAYQIFFKEKIKEGLNLREIAALWKKCDQKTKDKYEEISLEEKQKYEKIKDQMELGLNLKPKRYSSAYNLFVSDMYEKGLIQFGMGAEISKKWKEISQKELEKFEKISAKERIIYIVKKRNYEAFVKKDKGKPPSSINLYYADNADKGLNLIQLFKKWKEEPKDVKNKYLKLAEIEAIKFKEHLEEVNNRIYERPPNKKTAIYFFRKEKFDEAKKKSKNGQMIETNKILTSMFNNLNEAKRSKYYEMAKEDEIIKRAYHKEYKEKGYYIPIKKEKKLTKTENQTKRQETISPKKTKRGRP